MFLLWFHTSSFPIKLNFTVLTCYLSTDSCRGNVLWTRILLGIQAKVKGREKKEAKKDSKEERQ